MYIMFGYNFNFEVILLCFSYLMYYYFSLYIFFLYSEVFVLQLFVGVFNVVVLKCLYFLSCYIGILGYG